MITDINILNMANLLQHKNECTPSGYKQTRTDECLAILGMVKLY